MMRSMLRARIPDWPAMRYRGLDDYLSRGPVPTLEFQKRQIRTFAAYELNVYSPYFEHTLAYRSNPLIAPPVGAITSEQVAELVAYAKQYHIDVARSRKRSSTTTRASRMQTSFVRSWMRASRPGSPPGVSNWSRVDLATQLWIGRADPLDQARQRWYRESALPTAAEVGVPVVGGDQ